MRSPRPERPSAGRRHVSSRDLGKGLRGGSRSGPREAGSGAASRYLPRFFVESSQLSTPPSSAAVSPADALGRELILGPEDAHHALRVLRLGLGDRCEVVVTPADPGQEMVGVSAGVAYLATVTSAAQEVGVTPLALLEGRHAGASYDTAVGIVQALTRPAAMDFLLEKGTEVGASFFLVLSVAGSSSHPRLAQSARLTRWRRIVREASKQSKQLAIPPVEVSGSADEALDRVGAGTLSLALDPEAPDGLCEALSSVRGRAGSAAGARLALWVGPEGGWTGEELAQLTAAGARVVSLGRGVLRAETAGPVAVAVARLALGDW